MPYTVSYITSRTVPAAGQVTGSAVTGDSFGIVTGQTIDSVCDQLRAIWQQGQNLTIIEATDPDEDRIPVGELERRYKGRPDGDAR